MDIQSADDANVMVLMLLFFCMLCDVVLRVVERDKDVHLDDVAAHSKFFYFRKYLLMPYKKNKLQYLDVNNF